MAQNVSNFHNVHKKVDCNGRPMCVCRVDFNYSADCPTCITITDSWGSREFDLLPLIQAGETETSIALLNDLRRIRYYPEEYTRTHGKRGKYCDICIVDIEALMRLNEIGDVHHGAPSTGDTLYWNAETGEWEFFNLQQALDQIEQKFIEVDNRFEKDEADIHELYRQNNEQDWKIENLYELLAALTKRVDNIEQRLGDIEGAIYNWDGDKNMKIPRGNINVTSGGFTSNNGIFCRPKDQNDDLDFQ